MTSRPDLPRPDLPRPDLPRPDLPRKASRPGLRILAPAAGALLAAATARRLRSGLDLQNRVVMITGGSRGLGLALAREFSRKGAAVSICARNAEQVAGAVRELRTAGAEAFGAPCDVTDRQQVDDFVTQTLRRYERLDALVNNAGTITVGPLASLTDDDFVTAMDTMFWGVYHPTLAALPHLRGQDEARIVNITSIGGKVPAPHLLPYTTAKYAAVGFSEGLRAELASSPVRVTTVVPGLMRTGSHFNALTKGHHAGEFAWFGLSASLPITSTTAEHAARRIVRATRRGDAEVILTWQAHLAVRAHGVAPALSTRAASLVARALPDAPGGEDAREPVLGRSTGADLDPVDILGQRAGDRHRQPKD